MTANNLKCLAEVKTERLRYKTISNEFSILAMQNEKEYRSLTETPLVYLFFIAPTVLVSLRWVIRTVLRKPARCSFCDQITQAIGHLFGIHSETRFYGAADGILIGCASFFALWFNILVSNVLFDEAYNVWSIDHLENLLPNDMKG